MFHLKLHLLNAHLVLLGHQSHLFCLVVQLDSLELQPNQAADRYRLVRRVYLDLTGLPPTLEEADEFANDSSDQAYEKMVDRVLASPKLGERWEVLAIGESH